LCFSLQSFGDNSRILDSLFVNLLRVSFIDPSFDRCYAAHEWMSSSDVYRSSKQLSSPDGYSVEAMHTPTVAAAVHVLCRVEQTQDLTYSTRDLTDSQYRMEANMALMQRFMHGMSFRAKSTRIGVQPTATETIPYSLWILSAGEGSAGLLRTVTSQDLFSKGERQAFEHHATILRSLGLRYVAIQDDILQGRGYNSGKCSIPKAGLDPPIDRLAQFNDLPNDRLEISIAVSVSTKGRGLYHSHLDTYFSFRIGYRLNKCSRA
jgi:chromosome transmission fidelity protein 18